MPQKPDQISGHGQVTVIYTYSIRFGIRPIENANTRHFKRLKGFRTLSTFKLPAFRSPYEKRVFVLQTFRIYSYSKDQTAPA